MAIKRQWKKGTLKHRLVSYVKNFYKMAFYEYARKVYEEMIERNINCNKKYLDEIYYFCNYDNSEYYFYLGIYPEHNDLYLRECLYNLEEKAMRGNISKEEWKVIYDRFKDFTELWEGE